MTSKEFIELLIGLATVANTFWITYKAWKELRPTIKKTEAETDKVEAETESELYTGAQVIAEGATVSGKLLMDRIRELREDLENEKRARREDAAYFRRRFREAEREARDYRLWAAQLAKQVIEKGGVPVPFAPSPSESEQGIETINPNSMDRKEIKDRKDRKDGISE
jgi:hypothetical protein